MKNLSKIIFVSCLAVSVAFLVLWLGNPALAESILDGSTRENTTWFVLSVTLILLFSLA